MLCKMNVDKNNKKVMFEIISSCNLKCDYCIYCILNKSHSSDFLSKYEIHNLIDKFSKENISKLVLTGGEPTLHPSFLDISKYAISKIPEVSICTNGVILNNILENKVANLDFSNYTVSIDSHIDKIHDEIRGKKGALQKTLGFLRKLKLKNRNISIHITLHPKNIDTIENTIKFCKKFTKKIVVSSIYYYNNLIYRIKDDRKI